MKLSGAADFNAPAREYARKDFPLLQADASVEKALETQSLLRETEELRARTQQLENKQSEN